MQFDTTSEESAKQFGTYNPNKAAQNGYAPYPATDEEPAIYPMVLSKELSC